MSQSGGEDIPISGRLGQGGRSERQTWTPSKLESASLAPQAPASHYLSKPSGSVPSLLRIGFGIVLDFLSEHARLFKPAIRPLVLGEQIDQLAVAPPGVQRVPPPLQRVLPRRIGLFKECGSLLQPFAVPHACPNRIPGETGLELGTFEVDCIQSQSPKQPDSFIRICNAARLLALLISLEFFGDRSDQRASQEQQFGKIGRSLRIILG